MVFTPPTGPVTYAKLYPKIDRDGNGVTQEELSATSPSKPVELTAFSTFDKDGTPGFSATEFEAYMRSQIGLDFLVEGKKYEVGPDRNLKEIGVPVPASDTVAVPLTPAEIRAHVWFTMTGIRVVYSKMLEQTKSPDGLTRKEFIEITGVEISKKAWAALMWGETGSAFYDKPIKGSEQLDKATDVLPKTVSANQESGQTTQGAFRALCRFGDKFGENFDVTPLRELGSLAREVFYRLDGGRFAGKTPKEILEALGKELMTGRTDESKQEIYAEWMQILRAATSQPTTVGEDDKIGQEEQQWQAVAAELDQRITRAANERYGTPDEPFAGLDMRRKLVAAVTTVDVAKRDRVRAAYMREVEALLDGGVFNFEGALAGAEPGLPAPINGEEPPKAKG
jgi:hypothetical protein